MSGVIGECHRKVIKRNRRQCTSNRFLRYCIGGVPGKSSKDTIGSVHPTSFYGTVVDSVPRVPFYKLCIHLQLYVWLWGRGVSATKTKFRRIRIRNGRKTKDLFTSVQFYCGNKKKIDRSTYK